MTIITVQHGDYTISTDPGRLDHDAIFGALTHMYWAHDRSRETLEQALANSLCFGLYHQNEQAGLARVITDYATFAYVCDVYVVEAHRGHGLGKLLIEAVTTHPKLIALRRMVLVTRDAHGLYAQYGFEPLTVPQRWMERFQG